MPGELAGRQYAWLESLCQHSGYPLTGYRVRATDRTAARPYENCDSADGSFKRPQARALDFLHTEVTLRELFICRPVWHRK